MNRAPIDAGDSLSQAYALLSVSNPEDLARAFIKEDQRLLKENAWDYADPNILLNQVKTLIEEALASPRIEIEISENQRDDLRDALWFWYHHATGFAIWQHKDFGKAREFSEKALANQISENPNQITRLLFLLAHGRVEEATAFAKTIETDPDRSAARGILAEFAFIAYPESA
jgi:hypothetical protein